MGDAVKAGLKVAVTDRAADIETRQTLPLSITSHPDQTAGDVADDDGVPVMSTTVLTV
jgi:hypothetical protein